MIPTEPKEREAYRAELEAKEENLKAQILANQNDPNTKTLAAIRKDYRECCDELDLFYNDERRVQNA